MKLRTIFGCVLAGVLWVLLAADARCVASDGETPLPAPSELTRQVPVRVADAYGLRALLVRLSLEAGDTSAFDRMQDLGRDFPSRDGASGGWGQDASYVLSAVERRVPGDADLILRLRKMRCRRHIREAKSLWKTPVSSRWHGAAIPMRIVCWGHCALLPRIQSFCMHRDTPMPAMRKAVMMRHCRSQKMPIW